MASTQLEIAKKLGLSQATVSMALRGTGRMSMERREQILQEALNQGYRPNQSAQAIRNGKFGNISLLMSNMHAHSFLPYELMPGILSETRHHGTQLTLMNSSDKELQDEQFIHESLKHWSTDGLLINYTHDFPTRMLDVVRSSRIPSIWLNAKLDYDSVHPDDFYATEMATQELIQLGHRDIAYFDLTRTNHYSVQDRYNGYAETMHAHNLRLNPLTREIPRPHRYTLIKEWLGSPKDRPTAVITYEDREAIPLFAAAMELKIRVPEDLSIITVHDYPADSIGVAFTTVKNDFYTMGARSVEMLMCKIQSPKKAIPSVSIAPSLLPGVTIAPPPRQRK